MRSYAEFVEEIRFTGHSPINPLHHTVIVPVNGISKASAGALVYATTISDDVRALYIEVEPNATAKMLADWNEWDNGVDIKILKSPYRSVLRPLVKYVDRLRMNGPGQLVSIVIAVPYQLGRAHKIRDLLDHDESLDEEASEDGRSVALPQNSL